MRTRILTAVLLSLLIAIFWLKQINISSMTEQTATKGAPENVHDSAVLDLAFSPDNSLLVAGYSNGTTRVWRTKDWALISQFSLANRRNTWSVEDHDNFGKMVFISNQTLVVAMHHFYGDSHVDKFKLPSEAAVIKIVNVSGGRTLKEFQLTGEYANTHWTQAFSYGNNVYVYGGTENGGKLITIERSTLNITERTIPPLTPIGGIGVLNHNARYRYSTELPKNDGQPLLVKKENLEDMTTRTYQLNYEQFKDTDTTACRGSVAISNDDNLGAIWWDLEGPEIDCDLCDGPRDAGSSINIYDMNSGRLKTTISKESSISFALFINKTNKLLSSDLHTVKIWDVTTGKLFGTVYDDDGSGMHDVIVLSQDESLLAETGGLDITVWSVGPDKLHLIHKL